MIGVSLGILLSVFFFRNRGCGWLPQNRVLNSIANSVILRSDSVKCVMACHGISDEDVFVMLQHGDVMFKESNTQVTPKMYVIEGEKVSDGKSFKLAFLLRDSTTVIDAVVSSEKCDCHSFADATPRILSMPDVMVKKMFLNKEISVTTFGKCKMDCFALHSDTVVNMLQSGIIDHLQSAPMNEPHPRYVVQKNEYSFLVEMAEKKTRILDVVSNREDSCNCVSR